MKTNMFFISGLFFLYFFQSSIYDIQIQTIQGNNISMSSFANKKILITTVSSENPNIGQLLFLDSIQNANTEVKIIAVPALDFGGVENNNALSALTNSLGLDFIIAKAALVKKQAGINQHPLFRWLTSVNENAHFDNDVDAVGQIFIVSKSGILYSVLSVGVPDEILTQVLNQNTVQ